MAASARNLARNLYGACIPNRRGGMAQTICVDVIGKMLSYRLRIQYGQWGGGRKEEGGGERGEVKS